MISAGTQWAIRRHAIPGKPYFMQNSGQCPCDAAGSSGRCNTPFQFTGRILKPSVNEHCESHKGATCGEFRVWRTNMRVFGGFDGANISSNKCSLRAKLIPLKSLKGMAGTTRLELATSAVTGQRSNRLNYVPLNDSRSPQFDWSRSGVGSCFCHHKAFSCEDELIEYKPSGASLQLGCVQEKASVVHHHTAAIALMKHAVIAGSHWVT